MFPLEAQEKTHLIFIPALFPNTGSQQLDQRGRMGPPHDGDQYPIGFWGPTVDPTGENCFCWMWSSCGHAWSWANNPATQLRAPIAIPIEVIPMQELVFGLCCLSGQQLLAVKVAKSRCFEIKKWQIFTLHLGISSLKHLLIGVVFALVPSIDLSSLGLHLCFWTHLKECLL